MKEKFETQEWKQLKKLPLQIFFMVAAADGNVDKKEIEELFAQIEKSATISNKLHREILLDIIDEDFDELLGEALDLEECVETAESIKSILERRLTESEYKEFVTSMFSGAVRIAAASGGGFFRRNPISDEEANALAIIAAIYDVDVEHISS